MKKGRSPWIGPRLVLCSAVPVGRQCDEAGHGPKEAGRILA
ncbi:MAG: hypothetical protein WD715_06725 [Dongiaceae bacterium]